jgi:hypothetical protein
MLQGAVIYISTSKDQQHSISADRFTKRLAVLGYGKEPHGWLLACRQAMLICHCHRPDLQEDALHLHQVVR